MSNATNNKQLYAAIRIRGRRKLNKKIADTINMLNLKKPNYCTVFILNPSYLGMLKKAKDYITWGPISKNLFLKLFIKKAQIGRKKLSQLKDKKEIEQMALEIFEGKKTLKALGLNPFFRLRPPSKGFKNKKKLYPYGDLGPRENIDGILKRMI
jgi:large subunit ribosomal protein L30